MIQISRTSIKIWWMCCYIASARITSTFVVQNHPNKMQSIPRFASRKNSVGTKSKMTKKQHSLESLISLETDLRSRGYQYIIGSDDTGGAACVAGPVVCASCCILKPFSSFLPLSDEVKHVPTEVIDVMSKVNDSKVLSFEQRTVIYDVVMSHPALFAVTVAHRSPIQIDQENLLRATQIAFAESIENLVSDFNLPKDKVYSIVDGKISPKLYASERIQTNQAEQTKLQQELLAAKLFPVRPKVNADAEIYSCALASIIAGVSRERMMIDLHEQYPAYGFDRNMGHGSREHIEAIHRLGAIKGVHRMSFKRVTGR